MLKRFLAYYKPHKKLLALDLLASLLISVIGMVYPVVTNKMLNEYIPNKMYTTIVIAGVVVLVLSFFYLLSINWILTLIIFAAVPILVVVTMHYRKAIYKEKRGRQAVLFLVGDYTMPCS